MWLRDGDPLHRPAPQSPGKRADSAAVYRIGHSKLCCFHVPGFRRQPPSADDLPQPSILSPKSACIGPGQVRTSRPDRPTLSRLQPRVDSGHTCRRRRKKNSDCRFRLDSSGPYSLNRSPGELHNSFERGDDLGLVLYTRRRGTLVAAWASYGRVVVRSGCGQRLGRSFWT